LISVFSDFNGKSGSPIASDTICFTPAFSLPTSSAGIA
jgi:hypothetical protein